MYSLNPNSSRWLLRVAVSTIYGMPLFWDLFATPQERLNPSLVLLLIAFQLFIIAESLPSIVSERIRTSGAVIWLLLATFLTASLTSVLYYQLVRSELGDDGSDLASLTSILEKGSSAIFVWMSLVVVSAILAMMTTYVRDFSRPVGSADECGIEDRLSRIKTPPLVGLALGLAALSLANATDADHFVRLMRVGLTFGKDLERNAAIQLLKSAGDHLTECKERFDAVENETDGLRALKEQFHLNVSLAQDKRLELQDPRLLFDSIMSDGDDWVLERLSVELGSYRVDPSLGISIGVDDASTTKASRVLLSLSRRDPDLIELADLERGDIWSAQNCIPLHIVYLGSSGVGNPGRIRRTAEFFIAGPPNLSLIQSMLESEAPSLVYP